MSHTLCYAAAGSALLAALLLPLPLQASATNPAEQPPSSMLGQTQGPIQGPIHGQVQSNQLQLSEALALSLQHHASLAALPFAERQAQARQLQASLAPAPSLSLSAENFAGNGDSRGLQGTELTIAVSQLFEASGKRDSRLALANEDVSQQAIRKQLVLSDVLAQTRQHYLLLLQLQAEQQALTSELKLIEQALTSARQRAKVGAVADSDILRLQSRQLQSQLNQQQLQISFAKASADLAALWGQIVSFSQVAGDLMLLPELPAEADLLRSLTQAPQLQLWLSEVRLAQSAQQLAIANSGRDINVSAGVKHNAANSDTSLLLAVSIPLYSSEQAPNAGEVAEANARYNESLWQTERQQQQLQLAVRQRFSQLKQLRQYLHNLQSALLPLQQQMVTAVNTNYQAGLVDMYGLLSAQQELLDSHRLLINGVATFHSQLIELQRLTGLSLTVDGPRQLSSSQLSPSQLSPSQLNKNRQLSPSSAHPLTMQGAN